MSRIKSRDTKPEILVRKYLHENGLRYSLHNNKLPGKPDLALKKYKKVLFINGCFWHGHDSCKYFKMPGTNTEWWRDKIYKTKERDKEKIKILNHLGWESLIIWECELRNKNKDAFLSELLMKIKNIN